MYYLIGRNDGEDVIWFGGLDGFEYNWVDDASLAMSIPSVDLGSWVNKLVEQGSDLIVRLID